MADSNENREQSVLGNIADVVKKNSTSDTQSTDIVFKEDKRPSLRMKSIGTWNVWGMPLYSIDLSKRMSKWSQYIHDTMSENQQLDEEDLVVSCVQEAWGYRVGILGWPITYAGYKNSKCLETYGLSRVVNKNTNHTIQANDHEVLSGLWSIGTRAIPLLNAGVWDPKRTIARGLVLRNKELIYIQKEAKRAEEKAYKAEEKAKKAKEREFQKMQKKANEARRKAEELMKQAREAEEEALRYASTKLDKIKTENNETKKENKDETLQDTKNEIEEIKESNGEESTNKFENIVENIEPINKKPLTLCYAYGAGSNNKSVSKMFDLGSIGCKPILDSGCAIYANKPAKEYGFERWNTWGDAGWIENMANKGITWVYFEAPNRRRGIVVLNLHIAGASPKGTDVVQLKQLVLLKTRLEKQFSSRVMNYETYVAGDFNIEFGNRHENSEIMEKWNILRRGGFKIISESPSGSTCASNKEIDFVLYAPDEINHEDTINDLSQLCSMFEERAYDTRPVEKTDLSDHSFVRVDVEYET
jgi:hypothetical protein